MEGIFHRIVIRDPGGAGPVRVVSDLYPTDGSVLLVDAGTVGFLVLDGVLQQPFQPGRHVLKTGLSPYFTRLRNWATQGDPGRSATVFFLSTQQEYFMNLSSGEVIFREKKFDLTLKATAELSVQYRIRNPLRFLQRMTGMNRGGMVHTDLNSRIGTIMLGCARSRLGQCLAGRDVSDLTRGLNELSVALTSALQRDMETYGMVVRVRIQEIRLPDDQLQQVRGLEQEWQQTRGRIKLEKEHIREVYQNLNNRTLTELLTGIGRLPPLPGQNPPPTAPGGGLGQMAGLPIQMAMLQKILAMFQSGQVMGGGMPADDLLGWFAGQQPERTAPGERNIPPLPVRREE